MRAAILTFVAFFGLGSPMAEAGPKNLFTTPSEAYFADSSTCLEADRIRCFRNMACPRSYRLKAKGTGYICARSGTVGSKRRPSCAPYKLRKDWKFDVGSKKCVRKTALGKRKVAKENLRCPSKLRFNSRTGYCEVAPFAVPMLVERNKPAPFHPVFGNQGAWRFVVCQSGYKRASQSPYGFICYATVPRSNKVPNGRVYRVPGVG